MIPKKLIPISFEFKNEYFTAYLPFEDFISLEKTPEKRLNEASVIYKHTIDKMRSITAEISELRNSRKIIPARKVWYLGDAIFELTRKLEKLSFQVDNLYEHLERDLKVKRKWLEKVIILRRYITDFQIIPESLNWGKFEKGTKHVSQNLLQGKVPH